MTVYIFQVQEWEEQMVFPETPILIYMYIKEKKQ